MRVRLHVITLTHSANEQVTPHQANQLLIDEQSVGNSTEKSMVITGIGSETDKT